MGSCIQSNTKQKRSSKSADIVAKPGIRKDSTAEQQRDLLRDRSQTATSNAEVINSVAQEVPKKDLKDNTKIIEAPKRQGAIPKQEVVQKQIKKEQLKTFDISPTVIRRLKIYNISSKQPVSLPYSRDMEWQQLLQIYSQKLNLVSFQQNIGGHSLNSFKGKRPDELQNYLDQVTFHREIELMIKMLNLKNRNWIQEQIKMSRRLAQMQPGSFDSLVVTREYLQLKEHFHWFTWAVSFYYFNFNKIEEFFLQHQQQMNSQLNDSNMSLQSSRTRQQGLLYQEINHLYSQLKNLKLKLPKPISPSWSEGFSFQGVFFRMLSLGDSYYIKSEMKALKYIQTELFELNSIHNQLLDQDQQFINKKQSIYNQLILPLLTFIESGAFAIFASPTIYIPDYKDDSDSLQDMRQFSLQPGISSEGFQKHEDFRDRSLTAIYGTKVYLNQEHVKVKGKGDTQSFRFLQDNLHEIDDDLLKMMPLLKRLTKHNVIPILDFEDNTQTELNYLVLHALECIPTVKIDQSVSMVVPIDQGEAITYQKIPDLKNITVKQIENLTSVAKTTPPKKLTTPKNQHQLKNKQDSDFEEEDFEQPTELSSAYNLRCFTKHGFDMLLVSHKPRQTKQEDILDKNGLLNKRAQQLFQSREQDFTFQGLLKSNKSPFVFSMSQVETPQKEAKKTFRKRSILRKTSAEGFQHGPVFSQGVFIQESQDDQITGNVLIVAESSQSTLRLKYPMINHQTSYPIEKIFMESLQQIVTIIENTDLINNVQSLKDLLSRKGLNLRFEWLLLAKLKSSFHRELVMIHILMRTLKKLVNEELKLKALVYSPSDKQQSCDHFMGDEQDFKDTMVFITNTILRRKYSKQKHVFDEILLGLFLDRLKMIPLSIEIKKFAAITGTQLVTDVEYQYFTGKQILEDIISTSSQNPALFLNSLSHTFKIDIEREFMRKGRQDKFLFLSQLNSVPMVKSNVNKVFITCHNYFSIKEHAYLILASEISKQQRTDINQQRQHSSMVGVNQSLRSNIFKNQPVQKRRPVDLNINMQAQASVSSTQDSVIKAGKATYPAPVPIKTMEQRNLIQDQQNRQMSGSKNFNKQSISPQLLINQDLESRAFQSSVSEAPFPELILPSLLYKVRLQDRQGEAPRPSSSLLPFYQMPGKDIFNKWVMYLESVLNQVYTLDGTEGILLEALNYQALSIYFAEVTEPFSPLMSPMSSISRSENGQNKKSEGFSNFDKDQFSKVCTKIQDIMTTIYQCAPEILVQSQIICGLNFEQFQDDADIFPIEAEKSYLTALICLFHLYGDPRGRGNISVPCMLLIAWKLSVLSLCVENKKLHDSEFAEELFDAILENLQNHKQTFRYFQNEKLRRVETEKQNAPTSLNKQPNGQSKPSQTDKKEELFVLDKFELAQDVEVKQRNQFNLEEAVKLTNTSRLGPTQSMVFNQTPEQILKTGNNLLMEMQYNSKTTTNEETKKNQDEVNINEIEMILDDNRNDFLRLNFADQCSMTPEIPFIHWSIYRQSIQNLVQSQGNKLLRDQKAMRKFVKQMYKHVLYTAVEKQILFNWVIKYNLIGLQSGIIWRNSQIKQAVFFQNATMVSSRSSSRSFSKEESQYSLQLTNQTSTGQGNRSFRGSGKTQHLGPYSSIIGTDNGSINKGDIHGIVYSWGSDTQGQLGIDSYAHLTKKLVSQKVLFPRVVSGLSHEFIKDVCCGYQHTLAITINGCVYAWGNNQSGQLGLGPSAPAYVWKPAIVSTLKNICKMAAGNEHSVAINRNHELYTWGLSTQTGQNDTQNRDTPTRLDFFKSTKVIGIACGGLHTLAITNDHPRDTQKYQAKNNKVYCWGSTEGGQLGLPLILIQKLCKSEENAVKIPQPIMTLSGHPVVQVACGETHSICLTETGSIFGWGMSLYGQLGLGFSADSFEPGLGMEKSKVWEPRKIEALEEEHIQKIFCGSTFTFFLTDKGELYGCGMNDLGQLGEDVFNDLSVLENAKQGNLQTSDITIPTHVQSLQGIQINSVACGEAHVLAIDGEGTAGSKNMLWAWGQHKNGQLGLGEIAVRMNPRPIQHLSACIINKAACGSGHSVALVGDASYVTTLSPNYYASNIVVQNQWETKII